MVIGLTLKMENLMNMDMLWIDIMFVGIVLSQGLHQTTSFPLMTLTNKLSLNSQRVNNASYLKSTVHMFVDRSFNSSESTSEFVSFSNTSQSTNGTDVSSIILTSVVKVTTRQPNGDHGNVLPITNKTSKSDLFITERHTEINNITDRWNLFKNASDIAVHDHQDLNISTTTETAYIQPLVDQSNVLPKTIKTSESDLVITERLTHTEINNMNDRWNASDIAGHDHQDLDMSTTQTSNIQQDVSSPSLLSDTTTNNDTLTPHSTTNSSLEDSVTTEPIVVNQPTYTTDFNYQWKPEMLGDGPDLAVMLRYVQEELLPVDPYARLSLSPDEVNPSSYIRLLHSPGPYMESFSSVLGHYRDNADLPDINLPNDIESIDPKDVQTIPSLLNRYSLSSLELPSNETADSLVDLIENLPFTLGLPVSPDDVSILIPENISQTDLNHTMSNFSASNNANILIQENISQTDVNHTMSKFSASDDANILIPGNTSQTDVNHTMSIFLASDDANILTPENISQTDVNHTMSIILASDDANILTPENISQTDMNNISSNMSAIDVSMSHNDSSSLNLDPLVSVSNTTTVSVVSLTTDSIFFNSSNSNADDAFFDTDRPNDTFPRNIQPLTNEFGTAEAPDSKENNNSILSTSGGHIIGNISILSVLNSHEQNKSTANNKSDSVASDIGKIRSKLISQKPVPSVSFTTMASAEQTTRGNTDPLTNTQSTKNKVNKTLKFSDLKWNKNKKRRRKKQRKDINMNTWKTSTPNVTMVRIVEKLLKIGRNRTPWERNFLFRLFSKLRKNIPFSADKMEIAMATSPPPSTPKPIDWSSRISTFREWMEKHRPKNESKATITSNVWSKPEVLLDVTTPPTSTTEAYVEEFMDLKILLSHPNNIGHGNLPVPRLNFQFIEQTTPPQFDIQDSVFFAFIRIRRKKMQE